VKYSPFQNGKFVQPTTKRRKHYLLPVGSFKKSLAPSLEGLTEFAKAFFYGMEVTLLDPVRVIKTEEKKQKSSQYLYFNEPKSKSKSKSKSGENKLRVTSRKRGMVQLLTTDLEKVLKAYRPDDASCLIGLTMYDLYPEESWNFVFGEASPQDRVGVFSFARYSPAFQTSKLDISLSKEQISLLFYRSLQVMIHEIIHMFGVEHCLYFDCVMNGSNCLEESDEQKLFLCPIDLRKLAYMLNFSVVDRYNALQTFFLKYQTLGYSFEKEIKWLTSRIQELNPQNSEILTKQSSTSKEVDEIL